MEDFENQLQRKPESGELAKESVVESQRKTFRRRHPDAVSNHLLLHRMETSVW
jgi:hypothetical protein